MIAQGNFELPQLTIQACVFTTPHLYSQSLSRVTGILKFERKFYNLHVSFSLNIANEISEFLKKFPLFIDGIKL